MCTSTMFKSYIAIFIFIPVITGCKKLIEIDPPKSTIVTEQVFSNNTQAEWALAAVYSKLINGDMSTYTDIGKRTFSSGLATILGGVSADEFYTNGGMQDSYFYYAGINKISLLRNDATKEIWRSAYRTIFDANAVLEGVANSKPGALLDRIKTQITAEAKVIRAFAYFNLVNFFGDVPLVLTIDFNKTIALSRTPVKQVYEKIIEDLLAARAVLGDDYAATANERVRVTKWFAEALLARVYLYTGNYTGAINSASAIISRNDLFKLETTLATVFSKDSKEAIFQLKPNSKNSVTKSATPEGFELNLYSSDRTIPFHFYPEFVNSFDPLDKRTIAWMGIDAIGAYPNKYKYGNMNSSMGETPMEYYMVMRLAEMYLIRAEAKLLLSDANKNEAIADLNELRPRTGLGNLSDQLTAAEVKVAIAEERKFELFAEWGHRWFDLKRTGMATAVLSNIAIKQPWAGDYQLLYPIPVSEIDNNKNISQNPKYDTTTP